LVTFDIYYGRKPAAPNLDVVAAAVAQC